MAGQRWKYPKAAATPGRVCKDCRAEKDTKIPQGVIEIKWRPAPHPGPRCTTHHNAFRRESRLKRKVAHVERTYSITAEQYDALYAAQDGYCALCRVRSGAAKRLAVDHDHQQAMLDGHAPDKGCPNCIRGLVCSTCNDVLAHARSNPVFFDRGAAYLRSWPARAVLTRSRV